MLRLTCQRRLEVIKRQNQMRRGVKARPNKKEKVSECSSLVAFPRSHYLLGLKATGEGVRGVGLGFWCLSGAICMQNANSSGSFFARSVHSCISHPVLPGGVGRRTGLGQHTCALRSPGLGTEVPEGDQASGLLWQGLELVTWAKACQCLEAAKADWP